MRLTPYLYLSIAACKIDSSIGPTDVKDMPSNYNWSVEGTEFSPMGKVKRVLIIQVGATFRRGDRLNTDIGSQDSLDGQYTASNSAVDFGRFLKSNWSIDADYLIDTYSTRYDRELQSWYPSNTRFFFHDDKDFRMVKGNKYQWLIKDALIKAQDLSMYDAVLFIRADIVVRPTMKTTFRPFKKITFSFLCERMIKDEETGTPLVGDIIFWVPKQYFNIFQFQCVQWFPSDEFKLGHWDLKYYSRNSTGFWVDGYFNANSQRYWNPLYYMSNRNASTIVESPYLKIKDFDGVWSDKAGLPKLDINYCPGKGLTKLELGAGLLTGAAMVAGGYHAAKHFMAPEPVKQTVKPRPLQRERVSLTDAIFFVTFVACIAVVVVAVVINFRSS